MSQIKAALSFAALVAASGPALAEDTLNALVWCDHTDPALIEPFETANNVKVNLKVYEGTAAGMAILDGSKPGDWDVLVIDAVDVHRAVEAGRLQPMDPASLPTGDLFPELVMAANNQVDGKTYAVTEKFGYNTISYDKTKVDPKDMEDWGALTSGKYDGKIGIYDYYLPLIGLVAVGEGMQTADINAATLPSLKGPLMKLRKAAKQVSDVVASQTALATGDVDIIVGGGEWLTAVLAADNPNLDWTIPKQGGLRWAQSIGVVAGTTKPDLAQKFVNYIVSPEGQARLATASCYWGMPTNTKAGDILTPEQKAVLRWDRQPDYLKRSQLYPVPDAATDQAMQDMWTAMLNQ